MVPGASALKSKCPKCAKSWAQPLGCLGQGVPSGEQFVAGSALLLRFLPLGRHLSRACGPCGAGSLDTAPRSSPFAPHLDGRGVEKQSAEEAGGVGGRVPGKVTPSSIKSIQPHPWLLWPDSPASSLSQLPFPAWPEA